MLNRKTLYIIGAGASSEAELPTGHQLKEKIAHLLDLHFKNFEQTRGDKYIVTALRTYVDKSGYDEDISPYLYAASRISGAMQQAISIDNFIDTHSDDRRIELCGKLAIVRSILEAEHNSLLYFDDSNKYNKINFKAIENTWYTKFMMLLTENCTKKHLSERLKAVALIVFNYDRCIEHFLYNSLRNYYDLNPDEAGQLIDAMEIYHPYGLVGNLPWQNVPDAQKVRYGAKPGPKQLLELTSYIKTFTEGTDPNSSEILAIRTIITKADKIVFLGFAFHELNMKLMKPDSSTVNPDRAISCFGTAKGISDSDCAIISDECCKLYKIPIKRIHISNKFDCSSLFKEHWRNLSMNIISPQP
jgi:hypothetical protein